MRFHVLASDYDGTLAEHGRVSRTTLAALEKFLATGRKLVLVTGRELDDLQQIFPELHLFAWVVAENGGLLYCPGTREIKPLADSPPPAFLASLEKRRVPFHTGHSIVATWKPHEADVLEAIRETGQELQVIFNREAVMILPTGVNKATGLRAALKELGLSPHEVAGVGDAENDHAFLSVCECGVAVANGVPALRERADVVTKAEEGAGVVELIEAMIATDLQSWEGSLQRHHLVLGHTGTDTPVALRSHGFNLLIAGPSGSGKSTAATSFLERLADQHYQYCIIDPEGDYDNLAGAVTVGDSNHGPSIDQVLPLLDDVAQNVVVNLVGLPLADRPPFFLALLPRLQELRARTGRPHWLIIDEAHHLLPASWQPGSQMLPGELKNTLFITVHAGLVAPAVLATIDRVVAVGAKPEETIHQFLEAQGEADTPSRAALDLQEGEVLLWSRSQEPVAVRLVPSVTDRRRHTRKYAEGELPPDRSFYFRGPEGKLNLRAQNLILFMQLADGVDDVTWLYHLRAGDYERWFRANIKDEQLAEEAARIAGPKDLPAQASRALLRQLIERLYTLPGGPPLPMPGTDAAPTASTGVTAK